MNEVGDPSWGPGHSNIASLQAKVATVWDGTQPRAVRNIDEEEGLAELRARADDGTVWLETELETEESIVEQWFEGNFDVWSSRANPEVQWDQLGPVLEALGLPTPTATSTSEAHGDEAVFMRAIPYGFVRGVFGTVRDGVPDEDSATRLSTKADRQLLTAFPTVGFRPLYGSPENDANAYRMLRTIVGVVGKVVITVRLPDRIFAASDDGGGRKPEKMARLVLPRRFLPLHRMPSSRDLAEAIGIHQANTVRAVVGRIGTRLHVLEEQARDLADPDHRTQAGATEMCAVIRTGGKETDAHAEVAQQLERKIGQVLRRLGGAADAPKAAKEMAPAEVARLYGLALHEISNLQNSCRLTTEVIDKALADHEQRQSRQFQMVATALASIILVPTLIAAIFGASVTVPSEKSGIAFPILVAVIIILTAISYIALRKAQDRDWVVSKRLFVYEGGVTGVVLAGYIAFLALS
jgi:hypothetical protein